MTAGATVADDADQPGNAPRRQIVADYAVQLLDIADDLRRASNTMAEDGLGDLSEDGFAYAMQALGNAHAWMVLGKGHAAT